MTRTSKTILGFTASIAAFGATALWADSAASLDGRWDATLNINGAVIPFRLDISGDGATLKGTLYNGDDKEFTTQASYENGTLVLNQEHYLTKITATLKDGELQGKIQMRNDQKPEGSAFSAKRYVADSAPAADAPSRARARPDFTIGTTSSGARRLCVRHAPGRPRVCISTNPQ